MKRRRWLTLSTAGLATAAVLGLSISGAAAHARHARHSTKVAAPAKGGCVLKGTAFFSPGLLTRAQGVSYTFSGTLGSCQGTAGVKSGSVNASGSGSLSCANGSSSGSATISWNTGTTSSLSFTTTSAGALTLVSGRITGGQFAGSATHALIAFSTSTPTKCVSGGLPSASFTGPSTLGA